VQEGVSSTRRRVTFGVFELDLRSGELRKAGSRINLPDQPFRILAVLLEHPGELVTRDELRSRVWPTDTFVDLRFGLEFAKAA
jgi:DNA-binding winged helix-turn-helix (wHTH) protein